MVKNKMQHRIKLFKFVDKVSVYVHDPQLKGPMTLQQISITLVISITPIKFSI